MFCRPRSPLPEVHKPRSGSSSPRPVLSRFHHDEEDDEDDDGVDEDDHDDAPFPDLLSNINQADCNLDDIFRRQMIFSDDIFNLDDIFRRQILASLEEELGGISPSPLSSSPCPSSFSG